MVNEKSAPGAYSKAMYPVAAALMLFPLSDIASRLFPLNFGNLQWRFAFLGLSMSALSVLLIGTALLGFTGALRENRTVLRLVSAFASLIVILLVVSLVFFSLDTLQMRGMITNPAMKPQLAKMALSAAVAGSVHFVGFLGVAIAAVKAARVAGARVAKGAAKAADPSSMLVMRELETADK